MDLPMDNLIGNNIKIEILEKDLKTLIKLIENVYDENRFTEDKYQYLKDYIPEWENKLKQWE